MAVFDISRGGDFRDDFVTVTEGCVTKSEVEREGREKGEFKSIVNCKEGGKNNEGGLEEVLLE